MLEIAQKFNLTPIDASLCRQSVMKEVKARAQPVQRRLYVRCGECRGPHPPRIGTFRGVLRYRIRPTRHLTQPRKLRKYVSYNCIELHVLFSMYLELKIGICFLPSSRRLLHGRHALRQFGLQIAILLGTQLVHC